MKKLINQTKWKVHYESGFLLTAILWYSKTRLDTAGSIYWLEPKSFPISYRIIAKKNLKRSRSKIDFSFFWGKTTFKRLPNAVKFSRNDFFSRRNDLVLTFLMYRKNAVTLIFLDWLEIWTYTANIESDIQWTIWNKHFLVSELLLNLCLWLRNSRKAQHIWSYNSRIIQTINHFHNFIETKRHTIFQH